MRQVAIRVAGALAAILVVVAAQATSPIGWWTFDEGAGQVCADSSGHGNDGTRGYSPAVETEDPDWGTPPEAKVGPSCIIGNHNERDWVRVQHDESLNIAGPDAKVQLRAWIFPIFVGSDAVDYPVQIILWKGSSSASGTCNYSLDLHTVGGNSRIRFGFRDSEGVWQYMDSPPASIPDGGLWYFVSADFDATKEEDNCTITIAYTDGSGNAHTDSSVGTIFLETSVMPANDSDLRIGRRSSATYPLNAFHGRIDDVRLDGAGDRALPDITCPNDITVEQESPDGAVVEFDPAACGDPALDFDWDPPSGSLFPPGDTEVTLTATDDAGNSASCTFIVTVVDTIPPVTTIALDREPDNSDWYDCPVTVTLLATDSGSGVCSTEYSLDGGATWQEYTGPFEIAPEEDGCEHEHGEGEHPELRCGHGGDDDHEGDDDDDGDDTDWGGQVQICARSTDCAGNVETPVCTEINIDLTDPEVVITSPEERCYDRTDIIPITWEATDDGSGIAQEQGTLDELTVDNGDEVDLLDLDLGPHTVTVTVTDHAGRVSADSVTFNVCVTCESLHELVDRLRESGEIKSDCAARLLHWALGRKCKPKCLRLWAFMLTACCLERKGEITHRARYLMVQDASWLMQQ